MCKTKKKRRLHRSECAAIVRGSTRTRYSGVDFADDDAVHKLQHLLDTLRLRIEPLLQEVLQRQPERRWKQATPCRDLLDSFDVANEYLEEGKLVDALRVADSIKVGSRAVLAKYESDKELLDDRALDLAELLGTAVHDHGDPANGDAEQALAATHFFAAIDRVMEAYEMLHESSNSFSVIDAKLEEAEVKRMDGFRALGGTFALPADAEELAEKKAALLNDLKTGNFLPNAGNDDDWANGVIDLMGLEDNQDQHGVDIRLSLKPQQYKKYHSLQKQIANKIKPENWRPTIWLTIAGESPPPMSFGIIGGTGPLSDAEMLCKTMENLIKEAARAKEIAEEEEEDSSFTLNDVYIRLLSAPPPRSKDPEHPDTGFRLARKTSNYIRRTSKFSSWGHSTMALASNTAHLNLWKARTGRIVGRGFRKKATGWSSERQVQDLAGKVVGDVMNTPNAKPLVLGTITAFKEELYPNLFKKASKNSDNNVVAAGVTDDDAEQLQMWIDTAKGGGADDALKRTLQDFVIAEMIRQRDRVGAAPTHIILGCTELPLGLGGHKGIDELKAKLATEGFDDVNIIDTEDFFANEYTNFVMQNAGSERLAEDDADEEYDSDDGDEGPSADRRTTRERRTDRMYRRKGEWLERLERYERRASRAQRVIGKANRDMIRAERRGTSIGGKVQRDVAETIPRLEEQIERFTKFQDEVVRLIDSFYEAAGMDPPFDATAEEKAMRREVRSLRTQIPDLLSQMEASLGVLQHLVESHPAHFAV